MKIIFGVIIALSLSACSTSVKISDQKLGPMAKLKAEGKKRFVVFNKKQFLKPAGRVTLNHKTIMSIAKGLNTDKIEPLEKINGFTVEADLTANLSSTDGDWVVQEEIDYHTMQLYEIKPATCPQCPQCPSPNPQPGPAPTPVQKDPLVPWNVKEVKALQAQSLVSTKDVKICVIDTGADMNHQDLRPRIVEAVSYAGQVQDRQGHGTHTAGPIGAITGNGLDVAGVSEAKLYICKGLGDDGSGSSSQLANCLAWCGSKNVQIVSNSWGSVQPDQLINQATKSLTDRGILVFYAAGNDGQAVNWPARLAGSNPNVFAIAAMDKNRRKASFSSHGPEISYIAPGVDVESLKPGGGYQKLSGTSMATPTAAGVCAFGVAKGLKPCIKTLDLGLSSSHQGKGLVDALKTVQ